MSDKVEIKKGMFGGYSVSYKCPHCKSQLKSSIEEAGKTDYCPDCNRQFVVPGSEQIEQIRHAEALHAEAKRTEKQHQKRLAREAEERKCREQVEREKARLAAENLAAQEHVGTSAQTETVRCPYCAEQILAVAKKCKHCGELLDARSMQKQAVSKPNLQKASPWAVLMLAVFVGGFILIIPMLPQSKTRDASPTGPQLPGKYSAWSMTQKFVRKSLKSPSTASFGGGAFSEDYQDPDRIVTDLGGGKFTAIAWVDSQNGFGAMIRTHFVCDLHYEGNDLWRCTSLDFLE